MMTPEQIEAQAQALAVSLANTIAQEENYLYMLSVIDTEPRPTW